MNYLDHIQEFNLPVPEEPVFFMKPDSALLMRNRPIYYPDFTKDLQYETEIVVKIDRIGKHIQEKYAHKYYNELSIGFDFTARDLQAKVMKLRQPWELCKAFDQSAAIGKFVSKENYKDLQNLNFHLLVNGEKRQWGNTKDMIFSIDKLIAHVSQYVTLKIGDYIYTGTPSRVGGIKIGDKLEAFIEDEMLLKCEVK